MMPKERFLFVKDGKACARLFVKKSFTAWKKTFNNFWDGFYSSDIKDNQDESLVQG